MVTDGTQKAERVIITASLDALKSQLRTTLTDITRAEDLKALPLNQPIDLSIPDPDPGAVAQQAFLASYQQLQSAQRKVAAGLIKADDADLAALLAATQKLYLPAYLGIG